MGMGSAGQLHGAAELTHAENSLALQQGMGNSVKRKAGKKSKPNSPSLQCPLPHPLPGSGSP